MGEAIAGFPYRVVLMRRVSEEEQVNVECFAATRSDAVVDTNTFLDLLAFHRDKHNEKVLTVMRGKLDQLDQQVESKGRLIEEAQGKLRAVLEEQAAVEGQIRSMRKKHHLHNASTSTPQ